MPVIKSAKKRMRQNIKRRARNFPVRSELKSLFKKELDHIKNGRLEEAVKLLPKVYSVVDMACKKNIIHPNNAARKKSRLARTLNELQTKGVKNVETDEKKEVKKEVKAEAKEEVKVKAEVKAEENAEAKADAKAKAKADAKAAKADAKVAKAEAKEEAKAKAAAKK